MMGISFLPLSATITTTTTYYHTTTTVVELADLCFVFGGSLLIKAVPLFPLLFSFSPFKSQLPACLLAGCLLAGSCCGQTKDKKGTTGKEDKQATLL
jgi:hypothetical protein